MSESKSGTSSSQPTGECVICQKSTGLRCQACVKAAVPTPPFYCTKEHQKEDWMAGHQRACGTKSNWYADHRKASGGKALLPIDSLMNCLRDDFLPAVDSQCYKDFGFSNCQNEQEEAKLLALYSGLHKLLGCTAEKLHEACMNGTLAELIVKEYTSIAFWKSHCLINNRVYIQVCLKPDDLYHNFVF